jgi:hypothetical protein
VVTAVAVNVDPSADRVPLVSRLKFPSGPVAAVGEDAARMILMVDENMGGLGCYYEFQRSKAIIISGMPSAAQPKVRLPCPPLAWSARLASRTLLYSGVNGAS